MKNYSIFKHSFCTLSLFIVMLLHAGVTYAQEKLRISFSNVSLEEALKKIESASKYTFFYDDKRTDLSQKVSANANGQSIEEVLNAMLKTTNLTYEIDNRQIALIIKEKNGISQKSKKISGVVKDENNEPVIDWRQHRSTQYHERNDHGFGRTFLYGITGKQLDRDFVCRLWKTNYPGSEQE